MEAEVKKMDYQKLFWDFFSVAWRRKFWLLFPLVTGALVSVYFLKTLPKIYESSTFIMVEGQKIHQNIVNSAVTGTAQDRLSSIKQQVLSRSFLYKIIEKFALYESDDPSKVLKDGEKISRIRKNIVIATNGRRRLESFSISFQGEDPEKVMHVTNELASLVMEQNLKIREEFVEGAIAFLDLELSRLKKDLEGQESRIGDYKRVNLGELPSQLDTNLRALDRFQSNLESIQMGKKLAQDRIMDLERMLERMLERRTKPHLSVEIDRKVGSPLEQRLSDRREELSALLAEYSDDYPDVTILKRNVALLEKQVKRLQRSQRANSMGSNEPASESLRDSELEVHVSDAELALRSQLVKTNEELAQLVKKELEIQTKIRLFERRVENTPKREQEMVIMTRDYSNISENYQTLLNKKLNANISENLEKRQKGEQFRVIDSANFPEKPIKPVPVKIILMGLIGGLGLGVGLVFCRELLDNSIRNPEEVERITSVLVLAEIPDFSDARAMNKKVVDLEQFSDRKRKRRRQGMKG